jgi:2-C-methyl-D-erythritol 4-phosphate cytidylyltransferase
LRERLKAAALAHGKAAVVGPVFDTVKRAQDGVVQETIDRERLRWPLAWACTPDHEPAIDPPPPEWFVGAMVVQ